MAILRVRHRGLAPAVGRATIVGLIALMSAALVACDPDTERAPVEALDDSFYLEARVSVQSSAEFSGRPSLLPAQSDLRWWFMDDFRYRYEIQPIDSILQSESFVVVADGEHQQMFDPRAGTYRQAPLPDGKMPYASRPPISAIIGPLPAASLDEFIDDWRETTETVERVGTAEVLGRSVEVVEFGPIWRESSSSVGGGQVEQAGGTGRIYVDTDAGMVLRYEVTGNEDHGQNNYAEIMQLDLEPGFTTATFAMDRRGEPRGSNQPSSCEMHASGGAGGMWSFSSGYLRPTYDPQGWVQAGSGSASGEDCMVTEEWGAVTRDDEEVILFIQKPVPASGPPEIHDVALFDIGGVQGYGATTETPRGDVAELLWVQDGIIARLQTNAAPFEELVRIAESVEVVP